MTGTPPSRSSFSSWCWEAFWASSSVTSQGVERLADVTDNAFHDAALTIVQRELQREVSASQRLAHRAGVRTAEAELGIPGLYDPSGQRVVEEFEYTLLRRVSVQTAERIRQAVLQSVRDGKGAQALIPVLRQEVKASEARIRNIARTELNRAGNWGRYTGWKQSRVVDEKEFVATLDDRVRPGHLAADGERVPIDEPFTRGDAAGYLVPPIAPGCRCTASPVTRFTRALGPSAVDEQREKARDRLLSELQEAGVPITRFDLVAQATAQEIPGLRWIEQRHESRLVRVWNRWPQILVQQWGLSPALLVQP